MASKVGRSETGSVSGDIHQTQTLKRKRAKWIASSLLFQSTALAGTLVGVPMPFYAGRTYSRAYAQSASCSPAELQWETASGFSEARYFANRNQDIMGEVLTCTIPSGADTTTPQYAYSGAYLALFGVGGGNPVSFYGNQHYVNTQSQWGWGSPSVVVTNYADINVSAQGSNIQIMGGKSSQATGTLRASTNQSNGLSVVSLGALNWSPHDDNQQTGGGNAGKVTVTTYGAVSSTVGGGILALAKAGTSRYADGKNDSDYRYSGPVTVSSHASVSGDAFGIAALSVAGPGTYTSHKDYTAGGTSGLVTVKAYDSVSAGAGPAILAASYGGNTPFNKNQFVVKYSSDDGMSNDERYTRAYGAGGGVGGGVKVTVGTSSYPFGGQIVSKGAGQPGWSTRYNNFQLARITGAGIMAISRGGDGLGRQREQGIYDYTTTFAGAPSAPVSISVSGTGNADISTYGAQSPAVIAISQGGNSNGFKNTNVTGGNADSVSVNLAGAGRLSTSGAYSGAIIAQSIGGGGYAKRNDVSQGGASGDVSVTNDFSIVTAGDRSNGIVAQSVSAAAGNGDYSFGGGGAFVWGNLGPSQENGGNITVSNTGKITVQGVDSHGILAQSIGGGGGVFHATSALATTPYGSNSAVSGTDWQSIGGSTSASYGYAVTITNRGAISTYGGYAAASSTTDQVALGGGIAILAQSIGGGGGTSDGMGVSNVSKGTGSSRTVNGGIGGASYASSGSGSNGGTVTVNNSADLTTVGSEAHGIVAPAKLRDPKHGDYRPQTSSPANHAGARIVGLTHASQKQVPTIGAFAMDQNPNYPLRDLPIVVMPQQLQMTVDDSVKKTPTTQVTVLTQQLDKPIAYHILKNSAFDWMTVTPEKGVFSPGKEHVLTITVDRSKLDAYGMIPSSFIIKLNDGRSMPVTIYVKHVAFEWSKIWQASELDAAKTFTREAGEVRPKEDDGTGMWFAASTNGKLGDRCLTWQVDLPQDGLYYLAIQVKTPSPSGLHDSAYLSVDGEEARKIGVMPGGYWHWSPLTSKLQSWELKKGVHTFKLYPREPIYIKQVRMQTDAPSLLDD
mgnify:CR=1 FL=1